MTQASTEVRRLEEAVRVGEEKIVKVLLANAAHVRDGGALCLAAQNGKKEICEAVDRGRRGT